MREPEAYRGREQTYLKHYFLERYLEGVAYRIGWLNPEFVYVDGFSGPWRSKDEDFEDTSFMIAVRKLRQVSDSLAKRGKAPRIRCLFIEKDHEAFAELQRATESIDDIEVRATNGDFEAVLPQIIEYIGSSFALTFIDPTGWTGFSLETIAPLLRMRGEVLINFMLEHIRRFLHDNREATAETYNALFGGPGWEGVVEQGEAAIIDFYQERLKHACSFDYATRTRVLMPLRERTYFYLVYATRHWKGLSVFRTVEKRFLKEQGEVRADAKQSRRIERTGQAELFRDADADRDMLSLDEERRSNLQRAREILLAALGERSPLPYEETRPPLLELPMVDESAAKRLIRELHDQGALRIEGLQGKQRLPEEGCRLSFPS